MDFQDWIIKEKKKATSTAHRYNGALKGRLSCMSVENKLMTEGNLLQLKSYVRFIAIKNSLIKLDEFIELNSKGHNMYSCALEMFSEYLEK